MTGFQIIFKISRDFVQTFVSLIRLPTKKYALNFILSFLIGAVSIPFLLFSLTTNLAKFEVNWNSFIRPDLNQPSKVN